MGTMKKDTDKNINTIPDSSCLQQIKQIAHLLKRAFLM